MHHRPKGLVLLAAAALVALSLGGRTAHAAGAVDVWWPTDGAHVQGTQPFKALLEGAPADQYQIYWQVDGGQLNPMSTNNTDYPHKEASVDLSGWTWKGAGPYVLTFVAEDAAGNRISEKSTSILIDSPSTPSTSSTAVPPKTTTVSQAVSVPSTAPVLFPAPSTSATATVANPSPHASPAASLQIWWPVEAATISGVQPFKGMLPGVSASQYDMYWQVNGGQMNLMTDNSADYPHKESSVDLSGWTWSSSGDYTLTFTAKAKTGGVLAANTVHIRVPNSSDVPVQYSVNQPAPIVAQTSSPVVSTVPASSMSGDPFAGTKLYVDPNSDAEKTANAWRASRPADAADMDKIAAGATTFWMGGWNTDVQADANDLVNAAQAQGAMPVFVAYNIPQRDCGSYSAGGANSPDAYRSWIRALANGIGNRKAAVIVEPDALAGMDCLSSSDQQTRVNLIKDAVSTFKAKGIAVYLDAGNSNWIGADEMAKRLTEAGLSQADGFALNISNFTTDQQNIDFGTQVSQKSGGKHFLVDTSRNGSGSDGEWCNPGGRSLGRKPTTNTGNPLVDAYLWVKGPGGSDGQCNGGPAAGVWWPDYALGLAKRASY